MSPTEPRGSQGHRAGYGAERSQGSMHREVSMHESRPEQSAPPPDVKAVACATRWMEVTSWSPGAVDCTVWNDHHRTRLACRRPGPGADGDIERGKVPSAARVACIARSACTSLDQNSNRQLEFTPPSSARTKGDETR